MQFEVHDLMVTLGPHGETAGEAENATKVPPPPKTDVGDCCSGTTVVHTVDDCLTPTREDCASAPSPIGDLDVLKRELDERLTGIV